MSNFVIECLYAVQVFNLKFRKIENMKYLISKWVDVSISLQKYVKISF